MENIDRRMLEIKLPGRIQKKREYIDVTNKNLSKE